VEGRRPCVVLANGFSMTADSGLGRVAERFAAAGIDALAFDYRHFGASDGEPRQLLSTKRQVEDYAAAIACARGLEGVDPERIALWGFSLAGGHVIAAAVADGRVAAVVSLFPFVDGPALMLMLARTSGARQLMRMTLLGLRDRAAALRGRAPVTLPVLGDPGSGAAITAPAGVAGMRSVAGPSWRNEVAARIGLSLASYRPGAQAERVPCPWLVQTADRDEVVPTKAAQAAAFRASGRAEVRTYPVRHFDVWAGEPFERAVADQIHFLRRHLALVSSGRGLARAA